MSDETEDDRGGGWIYGKPIQVAYLHNGRGVGYMLTYEPAAQSRLAAVYRPIDFKAFQCGVAAWRASRLGTEEKPAHVADDFAIIAKRAKELADEKTRTLQAQCERCDSTGWITGDYGAITCPACLNPLAKSRP